MLTLQQALQQYFGYDHFREGQEEAIERVLNGQHTLLVMPTGSGKSLAYQLPAMLMPGLTLVISPLISLMKDQVDSLVETGIPATYINSSLPNDEIQRRMRAMREGHLKLLYIAPERLRSRQFTRALANIEVNLLAVDEAHCISQWGHDFRPDYLQIGPIWQAMGKPTLLSTTATATPSVQKDIIKLLGLKKTRAIVTGFNRPNLTFRVKSTPDARTKLQILQSILGRLDGSAIVYAGTRRNTEEVADFIRNVLGLPAQAYHAGLDRHLRHQVQTDFMADRLKIVVATNAFGMGIDKPDVRAVTHYNMPGTVEAYYQEAGRAGRDGLPAECVLLFSPDDQGLQEWFITSDTPAYEDLCQIYDLLSRVANTGEVFFATNELAEITGLHPIKVRVTLSELELAGAIFHLGDRGGHSHWRVLSPGGDALEERARAVNRRAQIRFDLLGKILDYAYLMTCRRKFLLNYFGDVSPPRSPRCCDNHTTASIEDLPKAVTPQEWFPLIVLETVRSLQQRPVGRNRLAQLLNGSRAKPMKQFGYDQHKFYGKLSGFSQPQITALIDALISARYLRISGGDLPVLTLTPFGSEVLKTRAAVPVHIPGLTLEDDTVERWKMRPERSDTVMETFDRFKQGLTPAQIAAERDLKEETVYTHLARLIGDGKVELRQVIPLELESQITKAIAEIGSTNALSPLKTILPNEILYGQIKCVLAVYPEGAEEKEQDAKGIEKPAQRVVALGQTGDPEGVPELIIALTHNEGNVRRLAASALGKIGDPRAVEPLIELLTDEEKPQARQYAIKALGKIGDSRARPILERIAADPDEPDYNVKAANFALEKLPTTPARPTLPVTSSTPPSPGPPTPQPPGSPTSTHPPGIILETVTKLGGTLGRTGLAQFLTGSRAAWLDTFVDHSYYGQLSHLSQKSVINIIDALIADGKLIITGGGRPKVILPDQSLQPTQAAQPTEVELTTEVNSEDKISSAPPLPPSPAPRAQPQPNQPLLKALRTWRSEQAREQGVPPYIVFPKKVLEAIATQGPATLAQLGGISGIGPAKLEQYGQAVLSLVSENTGETEPGSSSSVDLSLPSEIEQDVTNQIFAEYEITESNLQLETGSSKLETQNLKLETQNPKLETPLEAILNVVSDLDGLLTPRGLALLLTSAPGDVAPFSDHELFGTFHGVLTPDDMETHIQKVVQTGRLSLSSHQRLVLVENG